MTTNQALVLRRGNKSIDLNTAPYAIGQNFTIPAVTHTSSIARGSSANVSGGGLRTSVKYDDRSWTFDLNILGSSDADVRISARRVSNFLYSLNNFEATYLEYRGNTDTPAPLWGNYNAPLRFEIVDILDVHLWDEYAILTTRERAAVLTITVEIKPFALGAQQRLATATGGIIEDQFGRIDGLASGVVIPEATTNLFTNPVLGHATFGTLWTAGSLLYAASNINPDYCLPGLFTSVRLSAAGSTANTYTQSLTLSSGTVHALSAYVKMPDSSAVSATQMQLSYGGTAQTTAYYALGNGFYRADGTVSGTGGALATGVVVKQGYSIFLAGIQAEAKSYPTYLCQGDMLGCAWTGTAHASTSTRTAANLTLPVTASSLNANAGSIRIVTTALVSNTTWGTTEFRLFTETVSGFRAWWTSSTLGFTDGTNSISQTGQTFAIGERWILHFVWSATGLKIYKNGAEIATGVAHTIAASMTTLGIMCSGIATGQGPLVCNGFATFDRALTVTEVAADYANLAALITDGRRVESIPWFWTDDGDNVLSLDTGKQPLGIVSGVTGSAPAVTEIQGALSSTWGTISSIAFSSFASDTYIPFSNLFEDVSGTATAGDYGGQHKTTTVNGSHIQLDSGKVMTELVSRAISGMEFYLFTRLYGSAGSAITLNASLFDVGRSVLSLDANITPETSYRLFHTQSLVISNSFNTYENSIPTGNTFSLFGSKVSADVNISVDYVAMLIRPVAFLTGGTGSYTGFFFKGNQANECAYPDLTIAMPLTITGDVIEFEPDRLNHLQCYFCPDGTVNPLTTYQATLSAIYIAPRFTLV